MKVLDGARKAHQIAQLLNPDGPVEISNLSPQRTRPTKMLIMLKNYIVRHMACQ